MCACIMQTRFALCDQTVFFHAAPSCSTQIRPTLWLWQDLSTSCYYKSQKWMRNRTAGKRKYKITSLDPSSSFVPKRWEILCSQVFHRWSLIVSFLSSKCLISKPSGLVCRSAELSVSAESGRAMLRWFTASYHTVSALKNQVPVGSNRAAAVLT